MSLTIRMRRALAAFRSNPDEFFQHPGRGQRIVTIPLSIAKQGSDAVVDHLAEHEDSPDWKIHSDYHRSRVIHGKRLNWHINGKGKQSAQYGTTMYYGSNVRQLFRGLGLKDTW